MLRINTRLKRVAVVVHCFTFVLLHGAQGPLLPESDTQRAVILALRELPAAPAIIRAGESSAPSSRTVSQTFEYGNDDYTLGESQCVPVAAVPGGKSQYLRVIEQQEQEQQQLATTLRGAKSEAKRSLMYRLQLNAGISRLPISPAQKAFALAHVNALNDPEGASRIQLDHQLCIRMGLGRAFLFWQNDPYWTSTATAVGSGPGSAQK